MIRTLCHLPLLLWLTAAVADYPLEIIQLHGRPVEEVIPIVRPFIAPGGSVAGMGDQLILRTSKQNLKEIRRILEHIDRPPRRLMISVRQGARSLEQHGGVAADVRIEGDGGSIGVGRPPAEEGIRLRGIGGSTRSDLNLSQRIQTLEGRPAFIATGRSVPVTGDRFVAGGPFPAYGERTYYRDQTSGFYALPRLNGDRVTIEISPRIERRGSVGGEYDWQQSRSVISGRLGEWIPLAASTRSTTGEGSAAARHYGTSDRNDTMLFLKVEEIP